jgi:hypothetical protein
MTILSLGCSESSKYHTTAHCTIHKIHAPCFKSVTQEDFTHLTKIVQNISITETPVYTLRDRMNGDCSMNLRYINQQQHEEKHAIGIQ